MPNHRFRPFAEVRLKVLDDGSWRKTAVPVVDERQWNCKRRTCYPHSNHPRLSTNLPALQEGAVPVMFALLDARSMTCG